MLAHKNTTWSILETYIGKNIKQVQLILFVYHDEIERDDNPLQLTFADGSVLHFWGGSDGESLVINSSAWVDPFPENLSEENKAYIAEFGKLSLFNVSEEEPFNTLLNQIFNKAFPIYVVDNGSLCGVQIFISDQVLSVVNEFDEIHLFWGKDNPELLSRDYLKIDYSPQFAASV